MTGKLKGSTSTAKMTKFPPKLKPKPDKAAKKEIATTKRTGNKSLIGITSHTRGAR